jgi:serine/threonine protein kinase
MSESNVAPIIYDMGLSNIKGIMIMNEYDGTLSDLSYLYQTNKNIPIDKIIQLIQQMLEKIHQQGVVYRDLNTENILYTTNEFFAIGNFELAIYSTSEELIEII